MSEKRETFYDLASLAKSLITAPLAIAHLDLDKDYLVAVGFEGSLARPEMKTLTPRQLLSHTSGLPPWLPYNSSISVPAHMKEIDAKELWGVHKLLRLGIVGTSVYSDLNFRVLGEILESETGQSYQSLAADKHLVHTPWNKNEGEYPLFAPPDGPDNDTWALASLDGLESYPPREDYLPHDANSRAGMKAHAGFGGTRSQFKACLQQWLNDGHAAKQAIPQAQNEEGKVWGLGLWKVYAGEGRHGDILKQIEKQRSDLMQSGLVTVLDSDTCEMYGEVHASEQLGEETDWWMHTGFTGPIVFYHSTCQCVIAILIHRVSALGELCTLEERTARHYHLLNQLLQEQKE